MNGNIILMAVLLATMLGLVVMAFSGPSPEKAQKRRMELIHGRHSDSTDAILEARMRKAISNRPAGNEASMLVSLVPHPENLAKRIRMTGKKWTVSQYMTASAVIFLALFALLMLRGFPPLFAVMLGLAAGLGLTHMWLRRLIQGRVLTSTAKFPDSLALLPHGLRAAIPDTRRVGK